MNLINSKSLTSQESAINNIKEAKLAIATIVSQTISREEKRDALGDFQEQLYQSQLITTTKEFYSLIPEENLELLREDLDRLFREYDAETDFFKQLLLKNQIKNNFRRIIPNEKTFEKYYEYLREKEESDRQQKICEDLEKSLNQDSWESSESDDTQNSDLQVTVEESEDFPDDRFLVKNLIPAKGLTYIVSHQQSDQTNLACEIAHSLVTNQTLFNHFPVKAGKVLIFSLSEDQQTTEKRFMSRGFSVSEEYSKNLVIKNSFSFRKAFDLEPYLKHYQPDLVIIDYVNCLLAQQKNVTWNNLEEIKYGFNRLLIKYNCAGVFFHHHNYFDLKDLAESSKIFEVLTQECQSCIILEKNDDELALNAFGADVLTKKYRLSQNQEDDWEFMGIYKMEQYP